MSIRYGPFKILWKIDDNAFQLELLAYVVIYLIVNVSNLKPFELSMLDDELEILLTVDDLVIDQKMMLVEDTILEKITRRTRDSEKPFESGGSSNIQAWPSGSIGMLAKSCPHLQF